MNVGPVSVPVGGSIFFAFCFFFLLFILWPVGYSLGLQRVRQNLFLSIPFALICHFSFSAILSAVTYHWFDFGPLMLVVCVLGATIATLVSLRILLPILERVRRGWHKGAILFLLVFLALVAVSDIGFIFFRQGWSFELGQTYFRPPLHNDLQRHTLLVNALIRKSGSPFLPNSEFLYQLFWHHLAANVLAVVPEGLTRYYAVLGSVLFTGFLFYFVLLWFLCLLRPGWFLRPMGLVVLFLCCALHSDFYGYLVSWLTQGVPGIEADWGFKDVLYLRYFTPKMIAMTAPQHAAFFMAFLLLLVCERLFRSLDRLTQGCVEAITFVLCFLISPLMCAFVFVPYGCARIFRRGGSEAIKLIIEAPPLLGMGFLSHRFIFGFWPHELFLRPGTSSIQWVVREWRAWVQFPFLFIACAGILGLLLIVLVRWKRVFIKESAFAWMMILPFGVCFNFLVTDVEIRRHFAMPFLLATLILVARLLPPMKSLAWFQVRTLGWVGAMGLFLHGFFIYSYVGKPSVVNPNFPWGDYFAMRDLMREKFPKMPFIAVSDPAGIGIEYAIPMEVTTGFSMPPHAVIHTRLKPWQFRYLQKIYRTGDVAPYAEKLGYQAILWGPVERQVWGERTRKRFIKPENLLAKTGMVELYRLADTLHERFDPQFNPRDPAFYVKVADAFAQETWYEEALGYYLQAIQMRPDFAQAHLGAGKLLARLGNRASATAHLQRVEELIPKKEN